MATLKAQFVVHDKASRRVRRAQGMLELLARESGMTVTQVVAQIRRNHEAKLRGFPTHVAEREDPWRR